MTDNAYARGKKLLRGDYSQYTPTGKSYFVKAGQYHKIPQLGDIVYFYYSSMKRVGHVGTAVVVSVDYNKQKFTMQTVEGNTNSSGSRNGGSVASHSFTLLFSQVGSKNRVDGFGRPAFGEDTCTAEEFIRVLLDEVGYIEKASNKQLNSKTANAGDKNYTKYGAWYGNNGAYWCQQFISWCAYEACRRHMEAAKTGWEKLEDGNWIYRKNGRMLSNEWEEIKTKAGLQWFVFDGAGRMIIGWFKSDEGYYYLQPEDGAMLAGQWVEVEGKSYYLTKSGLMAANAYVKSKSNDQDYYWVDENGEWIEEETTSTPDLKKNELAE